MRALGASARARGFSLIEVMVSLIVICVGLLGIAKLQALSLSNTTTSRLRALAAIEAASLAAAMHSNRQYWGATPPVTVTVTASAAPPSIASTDAALQTATNNDLNPTNTQPSTACIGTVGGGALCTAVPLAAFDLARWTVSLAALLPNATAAINCPPIAGGAAPASCTIQVCWTEQAGTVNRQETGAAVLCNLAAQGAQQSFQVPTYTLYVEP
jgi:type IV pilus assembly protein PilV